MKEYWEIILNYTGRLSAITKVLIIGGQRVRVRVRVPGHLRYNVVNKCLAYI